LSAPLSARQLRKRERKSTVIAFIQPFVPTYRVGLFNAIAAELAELGLVLEVWHDNPKGIVAARGNASQGVWSVPIHQRRLTIKRRNVTYRNVHRKARGVRAVVAGLASTNLETYLLALDPEVNLLLWGHGRNFTASQHGLDIAIERWLIGRSRHVFTYTERGAEYVTSTGTDPGSVTVVRNSTDTEALRGWKREASAEAINSEQERFKTSSGRTALFVGAFDEPKRLPFLFAAADLVAERLPDFRLLLAGAGPLDDYVAEQVSRRPYARLLGRVEAERLAMFSHIADVMLMPGRVGLVAVDALALGIPVVTTDYPYHAPEADYLSEENSVWTRNDVVCYADEVVNLLSDEGRLDQLSRAAYSAGLSLSTEASARAFTVGIRKALLGSKPRSDEHEGP